MNCGLAQINTTVGDFSGNADKILHAYRELVGSGAEFVVTPELAVCGYAPMDLVLRPDFIEASERHVAILASHVGGVPLVVGSIESNTGRHGRPCFNIAAVLQNGRCVATVSKSLLPTYDVFDEGRYFEPASRVTAVTIAGRRVGITICEDLWTAEYLPRNYYGHSPVETLRRAGVDLLINLGASPFEEGKPERRRAMMAKIAQQARVPLVSVNLVGGNDQLVFDGHSFALNADGSPAVLLPGFVESHSVARIPGKAHVESRELIADIHDALVLGLRDYLGKCGFSQAVVGLSGGLDSAVTAALAATALGPENVLGVTMPGPYSSKGSVEDSLALARNLGMECRNISINAAFDVICDGLAKIFEGREPDSAEENLQARLRGMMLMAISNKFGRMVLTTGNKSELAVGYCTLYGDMAGGLAVISDVPKTMVYQLAEYMNRAGEVIPRNTIEKAPSAELRAGQTDQDTLPPYDVLDKILRLYIEEQLCAKEIVARGFDAETVRWVTERVDANEYKRQQAAPGIKVTSKAFGIGRRMPIAQKYRS